MTYIILGGLAVIALLVIALVIAIKVALAKGKKARKLEADLAEEQEARMRQTAYQAMRAEAQQNADDKKEALRTGSDTVDFSNSLNMLHSAGKNRGR
jgi:hypothetical protein